ncbi:TetR/AcrR family transcriptional regulator [Dyadobacter subterraneus]|uniref:TetR/AcrR family transcriptional regulator n=1 Tax=Dyadobacter subterraneus TaxID=2773304 RepID=A0ABR9WDS1_9BACT|nr:TetR/AcrR family transcriptional regulator [Dyadobacter subterraneus]MBE9463563.1 TetR/AcrR family transcriptional regulator [Dyadobacter subterraneus]
MIVRNPAKDEVIQQQILLAAKQLFQKYGLRKVTMDDVAKAIGKGRSSLYYYYKSKEEIFDAVVDAEIIDMQMSISQAIDKETTAEKKLYAFFMTKLTVAQSKRSFFSTIDEGMDAAELSDYNKAKQAIRRRIMEKETAVISRILKEGIENQELRSMDQTEQESVQFVLLAAIHGLKREILMENDFSRIDSSMQTLTTLIIQGLKK